MTNGEKYTTATERAEAFWRDYRGLNTPDCVVTGFSTWLDLEAKVEDPLPCPFCGHKFSDDDVAYKSKDVISYCGWSYHCPVCGYRSRYLNDKDAAIAAHNRVARAAKEKEAK